MSTPTTSIAAPSPTTTVALDGSICTPQELMVPAIFLHCLTRGETIGLTLVTASAFLSLFALLYFFARVLINVILEKRKPISIRRNLVSQPVDVYMLSLFSANLLHAIGEVLNIKWVHDGKVYVGGTCWAQGVIQGTSGAIIALTTLAIALHTFFTLFWSYYRDNSLRIARVVTIVLWLFPIVLTAAISLSHRDSQEAFVGPSPQWCFIRDPPWLNLGILEEWTWLWLADVVCIVIYVPLFFWCLHYLQDKDRKRIALAMLIYPLVYTILVVPKSVTRLTTLSKNVTAHPAETSAMQTVFDLIGIVDVVVFFTTRQGLLLFGKDDAEDESDDY